MKQILTMTVALLAVVVAVPAFADDSSYRRHERAHVATHFEREGDRINARLDRQAKRVEKLFDRRADRAEALGNERLADHLRAKGDRIAHRLDREGDRIEARYDRRAERFEKSREYPNAYRRHLRHDHACDPRQHGWRRGDHLALQFDGLGIFWSHRR